MRGRRPIPTRLKLLRGNPGRRPLNAEEPDVPVGPVMPPAWLSPEARTRWDEVAPDLAAIGLLTRIDGDALAEYCTIWARWKQAEDLILKHGMVVRVNTTKWDEQGRPLNGSPAASPYVAIANRALTHVRAYETEFGKTPSSRSRVHVRVRSAPKTAAQKFLDQTPRLHAVRDVTS